MVSDLLEGYNYFTDFARAFEEDLSDMIAQESRKRQKRDEEKRGERKERTQR
jgi:splicing factor 3B subunit 2